jgi:DNA-binding NarL/FixJ family response regulator
VAGGLRPGRRREDTERVPITVVLAEDSYLMREGVSRLLETDPGIDLIAATADLEHLVMTVDEQLPDVVVTDIRMPPTHTDEGIQAAESFRDTHPQMGVVLLSQYDEPEYAVKLLARGAGGRAYLLKDRLFDAADLVHAVHEVAAGRSVIDPQVVEGLVASRNRFETSPLRQLSPREIDVLSQMTEGKNNEAISAALRLSVGVVEKHINSIFAKLHLREEPDVHRRVKAVLIYLSNGSTPR